MEKPIKKTDTQLKNNKPLESLANDVTRRTMLKTMAKAALAVPVFSIIPASALGLSGRTAPSNRVTLGVIGCGRKAVGGTRNFQALGDQVEILALCDPNDRNLENLAEECRLNTDDILTTRDYREVIDHKGIDAVLICTPDHWHAIQCIAAARSGKHIYGEKPLARTISEGRAVVDAIKRYNVVFQHGTQLKSLPGTRRACELVRSGRIGEITNIHVGCRPGEIASYQEPEPVPDWLDWELWQGPAPEAPYQSIRNGDVPDLGLRGWYFIKDYSPAGFIAGVGVHDLDIAHWGMGMEESGPVEIEGRGVFPQDGMLDTVLTFDITFRYANGMTITMTDLSKNRAGVLFEGTEGSVFTRGDLETSPDRLAYENLTPNDIRLYESESHEGNFIESIRYGKQTITPVEVAQRSTSVSLLAGIALEVGRKLRWDPQQEQFVNDYAANRLLSVVNRSPWYV